MQFSVVECDACKCRRECSNEAPLPDWLKVRISATDGSNSSELEVCPDCAVRVRAALGPLVNDGANAGSTLESIESIEHRHVLAVLTALDWNKSRAAKVLGIERSTLHRKLHKYRLGQPCMTEQN